MKTELSASYPKSPVIQEATSTCPLSLSPFVTLKKNIETPKTGQWSAVIVTALPAPVF